MNPKRLVIAPVLLAVLLLPALFFSGVVGIGLARYRDAPMAWLVPTLRPAPFLDMSALAAPEFEGQ